MNNEVKNTLNGFIIKIFFSLLNIPYSILKKYHYYFSLEIYNRLVINFSVGKSKIRNLDLILISNPNFQFPISSVQSSIINQSPSFIDNSYNRNIITTHIDCHSVRAIFWDFNLSFTGFSGKLFPDSYCLVNSCSSSGMPPTN